MALLWLLAAVLMAITVILLPWSRAAVEIANYTLWPFGRESIDRKLLTGRDDIGTGDLGFVGNVLWFLVAGLWLAIGHVIVAVPLALSIVGLPLAWAHLKLAGISLAPIGQTVVSSDVAAEARRRHAGATLDGYRG
jgi:uncharacterized membrane protein YccF (DUF307 family)